MRTFAQKPKATLQTISAKPKTLSRANFGQSGVVNSILHLQHRAGNQAVQGLLKENGVHLEGDSATNKIAHVAHDFSRIPARSKGATKLQKKLTVNTLGDVYEQEADRITDQVMATPAHTAVSSAPPCIQRFSGQSNGHMDAAPASVDQVLARPGSPLEPALRQDMERRFGQDFSTVRVHTDPAAEQATLEVNARAYAAGRHIVFARGQFTPETTEGRRLIAHELTHVLQQSAAGDSSVIRRAPKGGKPPLPTPSLPPASGNLARISELMSKWVPNPEKQRLTTISRAAAIEAKTGRRVHLIAVAGEGAGPSMDRSILRADEVLVPYTGDHAEIQTMRFAKKAGYQIVPGTLEASNAFCANCAWWAIKENLAPPPHSSVRVGQTIKPITSVTLGELSKNIPAAKMPGAGGEPTAKRRAKREQKAQKIGRARPPTIMPSAPVTTPMPPPAQPPMSVHEPFRMPPAQSPMSAHEPFRMPPAQSPMSVHEPFRMPTPAQSPIPAFEGNRMSFRTLAGGMVKSLAVETLVGLVVMTGLKLAWLWLTYEKNVESKEDRRLRELFAAKVAPGVKRALEARASEAMQMTTDNPDFPVYANVTVDLVKNWTETGVAGNPSEKEIIDASFVDLDVSFKKVSKDETRDSYHSFSNYYATSRVTYSVEIDFGETKAEHQWRRLLHDARSVARRNLSAESVAEPTHWGGIELTAREKHEDGERRKWGYPTLAEQRAYDERELWVLAYIEHTAMYGPDDQYSAALRYLEEIRRRPRPIPGQVLRGSPSR